MRGRGSAPLTRKKHTGGKETERSEAVVFIGRLMGLHARVPERLSPTRPVDRSFFAKRVTQEIRNTPIATVLLQTIQNAMRRNLRLLHRGKS